jgi:glycosyltransferase involved in cell wall biosynthesis
LKATLLLVGGGPEKAVLDAYAQGLGVSEFVVWAGEREDVRPFLANMDVGLLCSRTETLSLAAIEMMAMGLPMVMSDVGGASEIVTAGVNGQLFMANDDEGLVESLRLLFDPAQRSLASKAASFTAHTKFSSTRMVLEYEQLLRNIPEKEGVKLLG